MKSRTERHQQQTGLDPLFRTISNLLELVNSGTITIDIGNQPLLKLIMNQEGRNKINLEFGQKFMEMLLEASTGMISGKIRNLS